MKEFGKILIIVGIIIFWIGATTGTVTGYQGADGQYYATSEGSREWMCTPAVITVIVGIILRNVDGKSKKSETEVKTEPSNESAFSQYVKSSSHVGSGGKCTYCNNSDRCTNYDSVYYCGSCVGRERCKWFK